MTQISTNQSPAANSALDGCMVVDVTLAGRDDLACSSLTPQVNDSNIIYNETAAYLYLNTSQPTSGTSSFSVQNLNLGTNSGSGLYLTACLPGDFNGDGLTDFACIRGSGWTLYYSSGAALGANTAPQFTPASGTTGPAEVGIPWKVTKYPRPPSDDCLVGDFNGTGKAEIACYILPSAQNNNVSGTWSMGLPGTASSSPFTVQTWTNGPSPSASSPHTPGGDCWAAALYGSSPAGILCYNWSSSSWQYGVLNMSTSPFTTFTTTTVFSGFTPPVDTAPVEIPLSNGKVFYAPGANITGSCALADFNGDGLPDLACPGSANQVNLLLSNRPT